MLSNSNIIKLIDWIGVFAFLLVCSQLLHRQYA